MYFTPAACHAEEGSEAPVAGLRYVLVIALVGALAVLTVAEHVEQTRLGYAARELEERRARLVEDEKAARLAYERAVVPERLVERAVALGVARAEDLRALTGAGAPEAPGPASGRAPAARPAGSPAVRPTGAPTRGGR